MSKPKPSLIVIPSDDDELSLKHMETVQEQLLRAQMASCKVKINLSFFKKLLNTAIQDKRKKKTKRPGLAPTIIEKPKCKEIKRLTSSEFSVSSSALNDSVDLEVIASDDIEINLEELDADGSRSIYSQYDLKNNSSNLNAASSESEISVIDSSDIEETESENEGSKKEKPEKTEINLPNKSYKRSKVYAKNPKYNYWAEGVHTRRVLAIIVILAIIVSFGIAFFGV
jgi:hypothetical protein